MSFTFELKNGADHSFFEIKGDKETPAGIRERVLEIPQSATDENGKEYPVEVIGNHAFSSRKDIEEIHIPDSIHTILGFAFHNCSNLRKIKMSDSVTEYLDGSTRQCENLTGIEIDINRGNYQIIRRILEDNDRRLAFRMHLSGEDAFLVFPGFNYDFVENTMARTIQFAIEGTGYAYRECVKAGEINFREYDNMFSKASADDSVTAEMIAIGRLSFPYELSDDSRNNYENWLSQNALKNLKRVINLKNGIVTEPDSGPEDHFDFYIKRKLIGKEVADQLSHIASDHGMTALVGMLMNYAKSLTIETADGADALSDDGFLELDF
ncbi:leucine-rich repeat protein [Butyrivibrio sp. WCE2006]|uniref:leucine-rich repeat protein n=1 Tax=Butyrivibrio sp. WCE2006 TaxID=1410611 RepID=UPI00067886FE|nr:leucine-rich repeat protein [Butyrivibrio sp. WCE2006]